MDCLKCGTDLVRKYLVSRRTGTPEIQSQNPPVQSCIKDFSLDSVEFAKELHVLTERFKVTNLALPRIHLDQTTSKVKMKDDIVTSHKKCVAMANAGMTTPFPCHLSSELANRTELQCRKKVLDGYTAISQASPLPLKDKTLQLMEML